jgi:hypothetical protein
MTRRWLLVTCALAACVGVVLGYADRGGRNRAKPNTDVAHAADASSLPPAPNWTLPTNSAADPKTEMAAPVIFKPSPPKSDEPVVSRVEPKPVPPPQDTSPDRKAAYIRIMAAQEVAEAAAVKKYGRKPEPGDQAEFTIPFRAFVDREFEKALTSLAKEAGVPRTELTAIKRDGDKEGWPKR